MSDIAIEVDSVWKKFHRGEFHDSLRDFIPALTRRLVGRGPKRDELAEGDFWALRDVSFQVRQGEVLGIIGANGAGKSTLLKILAKILKPNRGHIWVNGRLRALIEVAAGFHPDLTGRENVYLNGTILGMKKREIDAKFDEIVEFSGISEFLDTPVKRYSSGMYARLGFAVAAHLDPEILIVDEVLAVGDAAFQRRCLGKMREVAEQSRTVLFVSHNMDAVLKLTSQSILLDHGAVLAAGNTSDVVHAYLATDSTLSCEWKRPAWDCSSHTAITAVRVQKRQGELSPCFRVDEPIDIEVDFVVSQSGPLQVAYRLNENTNTEVIFTSGLSDRTRALYTDFEPGHYRAISRIPADFLRPGEYHLLVAINHPDDKTRMRQYDLVEKALCFRILAQGSLVSLDGRYGAVAPILDWDVVSLP